MSAFGSFIAGTLSVIGLMFLAPLLAQVALAFGPPEYFALMLLGLDAGDASSGNRRVKALMMAASASCIGTVGSDTITGRLRFTFGDPHADGRHRLRARHHGALRDLRGAPDNLERASSSEMLQRHRPAGLFPRGKTGGTLPVPILRGSVLGFFLGSCPAAAPSSRRSSPTRVEKGVSGTRSGSARAHRGRGRPGVGQQRRAGGAFIPLLTLGIPAMRSRRSCSARFMIHGLQPGPLAVKQAPDVFWGIIASMYIGNAMLLVLNLPLIPIWIRLLRVPYTVMALFVSVLSVLGVYSLTNDINKLWIMLFFGVAGYVLRKMDFPLPPMLLGVVLGDIMEAALRQSLALSKGSWIIFLQRPVAVSLLVVFLIVAVWQLATIFRHGKTAWGSDDA